MIPMSFASACFTDRDYETLFESFRRKYASYTLGELYSAKVSFRNNVLAMRAQNAELGVIETIHSMTSRSNEFIILQLAISRAETAAGRIICYDIRPMNPSSSCQ